LNPLLVVRILTYNHESYIRDCLESVVTQQTKFIFKVIIGEDCSSDKTAIICKEYQRKYPDLIELHCNTINNLQLNSSKNWELCKKSGASYIALLEGDDYWLDPYKLQKQVDVLEANPEISAVCTNAMFQTDQGIQDSFFTENDSQLFLYNFHRQYSKNEFPTLTGVFRTEVFLSLDTNKSTPLADWSFVILAMTIGTVARLNEITAVYRIHDNGMYSKKSEEDKILDYISTANYLLSNFSIRHPNILNYANKIKAKKILKTLITNKKILKLIKNSFLISRALYRRDTSLGSCKNVKLIIFNGSSLDIGKNVRFRHFCSIVAKNNGEITIGDNCFFNSYVSINCLGSIRIGNNSIFGEGVRIYDHNHKYGYNGEHRDYAEYKISSVEIGDNCWIASNVVILAGVKIGNNVVIGAGCLIYQDIPSGKIVKSKQELIIQ